MAKYAALAVLMGTIGAMLIAVRHEALPMLILGYVRSEPATLRLTFSCATVSDDGTALFCGDIRNVSGSDLRVREFAVSNTTIDAIEATSWSARTDGEGHWWSLLPVGSFAGPDVITLRKGESIPAHFGFKFEPGCYIVRWAYTLQDDPEVSWTGHVEARRVMVTIPDELVRAPVDFTNRHAEQERDAPVSYFRSDQRP